MRIKKLHVLIACFAGGCTGAFVALELFGGLLLGIPVGSLLGYMTYRYKEVGAGIAIAWEQTVDYDPVSKFGSWFVSWLGYSIGAVFFNTIRGLAWGGLTTSLLLCFVSTGAAVLCGSLIFAFGVFMTIVLGIFGGEAKEFYTVGKRRVKYENPVVFALGALAVVPVALFGLGLGLYQFVRNLPSIFSWLYKQGGKAFRVTRRFMSLAVLYVHSERRTIVACYCAVGTVVGYFAGSAIVGGIVSAALGQVLGVEIIRVRILHLEPARTNQN